MTLDVTRDLITRLNADVAVTQYLQTYGGVEAIFSVVPDDAPDAYVLVKQPYAMADASSKNSDKYSVEQFLDVVIAKSREVKTYSNLTVDTIAEAVRRSLHRSKPTPQGDIEIEMLEALGPIEANADDYFGRVVQCRLIVREAT